MVNIFTNIIKILGCGVCRLARANTNFYEHILFWIACLNRYFSPFCIGDAYLQK